MLDVHILTIPSTPDEQLAHCVESVMGAVDGAGFPVDVYLISGIVGHIGKGRAHGYGLGHHHYKTCVDDDDYVLPMAFAQMREALAAGAAQAISTCDKVLRNGYLLEGRQRHHLIAYRQDVIIDHRPWACCGDVAQMVSIPASGWLDLPIPQYVHRV